MTVVQTAGLAMTGSGAAVFIVREAWALFQSWVKSRSDADVERARAERVEAEHDVQQTTLTAGMLATLTERLEKAEERAERAEFAAREASLRIEECERRHATAAARTTALVTEVATLRREMERRGWTPPRLMHAVREGEE